MKKSNNINDMSPEQIEKFSIALGQKVRKISDKACEKANKILELHGMMAKMQIVILPKEKEEDLKSNL